MTTPIAAKYERLTMLPTSYRSGMAGYVVWRRLVLTTRQAIHFMTRGHSHGGAILEATANSRAVAENQSHDRASCPFLRNAAVDDENYNLSITAHRRPRDATRTRCAKYNVSLARESAYGRCSPPSLILPHQFMRSRLQRGEGRVSKQWGNRRLSW